MAQDIILYSVFVPIAAGIFCFFLPDRMKILAKTAAIFITLLSLAAAIYLFIKKPAYWPNEIRALFIVDNLSSFIGIGISVFALLVTVYSMGFQEKAFGRFFAYLLMTLGGALGAAYANHLVILIVFWGFLAVTLYLMVNMEATAAAAAAAKKALIIIAGTDALMILGVGIIWNLTETFLMDRIQLPLTSFYSFMAFITIAIASFAKAGAMPFHSWLPDVAEDGPTPVTAYLPASLDKLLGIYLLARASMSMFIMNDASNMILLVVGSATIVLAVIFALIQHDLKRLLGYHAVSQVGYMVLGIGTGTAIGMAGGLFHMINHAIYKSCLFLTSGVVEKRAGTTDLSRLGGLAKLMPITFTCFLVAALSISGIPPFNGFVSKWMVYQGIIESASAKNYLWVIWLVSAMFGSALTVASFMKLLHAVFLGRPSKDFTKVKDAGLFMAFTVVILASACIIFGVFAFVIPLPILIIPAVNRAIAYIGIWAPAVATLLITAGIIIGFLAYLFLRPQSFRTVPVFEGGEDNTEFARVSGVEFYNTIKEINPLGAIYAKEEAKSFDIYYIAKRLIYSFTRYLQKIHNGVLPSYLVWCLMGMVVMFLILFLVY
ncbi:MAG: proton-conducting transporter membrane subunit [Candidatus Omnitrophica bacterium]|nr:proton-conducting transporter membrane subunit [Candidatus Omnitrophota bacterium]